MAQFDDYRIVQMARTTDEMKYLHVDDLDNYEQIRVVGAYRILKKRNGTHD